MSSKNLNLGTVVDKNKVNSDKAFIVLFKVDVYDTLGVFVNTLRFAKNSENVVFMGDTYTAANFDLDIRVEADSEPSVKLTAHDETQTITNYVEAYDGLVKSTVTMLVVHEDSLASGPAEISEDFLVTEASVSGYTVSFTLGVETAVAQRFPNFRQFQNRCMWKYKGVRCGYSGAMTTCDYTRDGANGCIAHGNELNFGGFPGLNDLF